MDNDAIKCMKMLFVIKTAKLAFEDNRELTDISLSGVKSSKISTFISYKTSKAPSESPHKFDQRVSWEQKAILPTVLNKPLFMKDY